MSEDQFQYRQQLLAEYGKHFQKTTAVFDEAKAVVWGKAYIYYFRDWLPRKLDSPMAEVGCGNGKLLHFLKRAGYTQLCGVDISTDQVQSARQVTPDVDLGNAVDWIATRANPVNQIFALDLIEHFTKNEVLEFINGCLVALEPGGRLIIQTPNAASPFGMQMRYGDFTHEVAFTPGSLASLLRMKGFVDVEARELGPVPFGYSISSSVRYLLWKVISISLQVWSLIEVGSSTAVLTRNFLIAARKPL